MNAGKRLLIVYRPQSGDREHSGRSGSGNTQDAGKITRME